LGHIDQDGNKKFSFEEAYKQIPEEWRSPEFEAEMRKQFNEIDTD
jgi:rubredoxin